MGRIPANGHEIRYKDASARLSGLRVFIVLSLIVVGGIIFNLATGFLFGKPTPRGSSPIVDLGYSQYAGTKLGSGINQYLGIRYAAPPLGDLRFRAPAQPGDTVGVQDATSFRPICLGISVALPSTTQAEDCLFLNLWSPAAAEPSSKLPVWVYIQGGGYVGNSNANYNGSTVVQTSGNEIVFLEFNYRVASWGFLAGEKVRKDGDLNAGLLDQRALLEWVRKYIYLFGGDPEHVVIHGASAGAGSVALHLSAYGGRDDGLFVGAIGESGFFPTQPQVSDLEWQFDRFVLEAGCAGTSDEMACLRSKDTVTLQAANVPSPYPGQPGAPLFYWTPTIDGDFIQDYPYRLFEKGHFVKVPIIFGDDTNEGSYFAVDASTPSDIATFFTNNYPKLTATDTAAINAQYPLMPPLPFHNTYFPSASAAYGDSTFTCPGTFIAQSYTTALSPSQVWTYRYNVHADSLIAAGLGVPHTFETVAIFGLGNVGDLPEQDVESGYSTYNIGMIPIVMHYWISFIRDLSPNRYKDASAPHWEGFGNGEDGGRRLRLQTNSTAMEMVPQEQNEKCAFWRGLAVTMEH